MTLEKNWMNKIMNEDEQKEVMDKYVENFLGKLHDDGVIDVSGVASDGSMMYNILDMEALAKAAPRVYEVYRAIYIEAIYDLVMSGEVAWQVDDYKERKGRFVLTEYGVQVWESADDAIYITCNKIAALLTQGG